MRCQGIMQKSKHIMSKQLDFFFNVATLGLKSGWYAMINANSYTPIHKYFEHYATFDDSAFTSFFTECSKYRKIAKKFYSLPLSVRRQLAALYDQQYQLRYPPEIRKELKELTGLAMFTNHCKSLQELTSVYLRKDTLIMSQIKSEAYDNFTKLQQLWRNL